MPIAATRLAMSLSMDTDEKMHVQICKGCHRMRPTERCCSCTTSYYCKECIEDGGKMIPIMYRFNEDRYGCVDCYYWQSCSFCAKPLGSFHLPYAHPLCALTVREALRPLSPIVRRIVIRNIL